MKKINLANTRSVSLTLRSITEFPEPLSKNESKKLLLEYQSGNSKSGEKLLVHNLRFLTVIISQYKYYIKNQSININDLMSEAMMGFYYALSHFKNPTDEMRGFLPYYTKCVQGFILTFLQNHNTAIKLPQSFYSKYKDIQKRLDVEDEVDREVLKIEIMKELDDSLYYVSNRNLHLLDVVSNETDIYKSVKFERYSKPVLNSESASLEFVKDESHTCDPEVFEGLYVEGLNEIFKHTLRFLKPLNSCIIKAYFGLYRTTDELYNDILLLKINNSEHEDFKKHLKMFYVPLEENNCYKLSFFFGLSADRMRQIKNKTLRIIKYQFGDILLKELHS